MKNIYKIVFVLFFGLTSVFSQKVTTQAIEKPSEGKSLVYFANLGSKKAVLFDGEKYIASVRSGEYIIYESDPGKHIFWKAKKPRNFVEANLDPNSVYVISMVSDQTTSGMFGLVGAAAGMALENSSLKIYKSSDFYDKKDFYRIVKNLKKTKIGDANQLDYTEAEVNEIVSNAMNKYKECKNENNAEKIIEITPDMKFENADKPIKN